MSQIILATNSPTAHAASYRAEQQAFHAYPGYGGYGAVPTAATLQYPPVPIPYPMTTTTAAARFPYYSEPSMSPHHQHRATPTVAPSSPDSVPASSSASNKDISQTTSPTSVSGPLSTPHILPSQQPLAYRQHEQQQAALVTPLSPRFSNATTERVKETIARANSVPMEFYHTEFLEYSKETYEKKKQSACKRNKRKRSAAVTSESSTTSEKKQKLDHISEEESTGNDDDSVVDDEDGQLNTVEMRRQIHIQSEQKRRAQIRDGFDELRKHLPGCNNKKMSKAALLTRTVQQLHHLKSTQSELLEEVERLNARE
ncbi:hypothetical protein K492DRAFT_232837 [Lichtheimia hyalospora FSU 10163]|nr:hypothetical protein K492DRAFT_232837 [Lichtheimia hyalospora FSU 10163]